MKNIIIVIVALTLIVASCREDPKVTECNPIYKTTGMYEVLYENINTGKFERDRAIVLENYDSCSYNKLFIDIHFNTEIINNECPIGSVKFANKIIKTIVTVNSDYNQNFKQNDTINSILFLKNNDEGLDSYILSEPSCNSGFMLSLTLPPDTIKLLSFNIKYMENDSTEYEITTKPIYILP